MEAKELRTGNWVIVNEECQIEAIIHDVVDISTRFETYVLDTVKPIPLTEEWLVRFGFKFDGHCSFWKSDIELTRDTGEEYYSVFNAHGNSLNRDGIVEYVHQLQNLYFAITGEELTEK